MDGKRLALAAVVAWFVDVVFGFLVWALMMGDQFAAITGVFRTEQAMNARLPLALAGTLLAMFALTYIYAKGYEGRGGVMEGLRFGAVLGLFLFGFVSVGIYVSFNIPKELAMKASVVSFVETLVMGAVIGGLYRPAKSSAAA
jgi:putative effector of murein hydrolase LrgA (UPF0299 family)